MLCTNFSIKEYSYSLILIENSTTNEKELLSQLAKKGIGSRTVFLLLCRAKLDRKGSDDSKANKSRDESGNIQLSYVER